MTSHGQNQSRHSDDARHGRPKADASASSKSISHGGGKSRGVGGEGANPAKAANAAMEVVWFPKAERYKRLGEPIPGGMGVVYKALDVNLDIEVAIKRIRPEFAANAELIKRFEREARTQVRLKHPNLVQVRDYAIDEIGPYIVMDWIEGQSLAQLVKDGPIEWKKAARIVGKCAMALHVAHEAGIIHRDIKPANILLNTSGEPFVTDFGLVRIEAEHSATGETVTGALLGTVDFMAPEQLEDPRKASVQSDIWSLGATLYRITTGRSVRGMRESLIPEQVREIVIKAMEEDLTERYATMKVFGISVRDCLAAQSRQISDTISASNSEQQSERRAPRTKSRSNSPAIVPEVVAESLSKVRNFEQDLDAFRLVTRHAQMLRYRSQRNQVWWMRYSLWAVAAACFLWCLVSYLSEPADSHGRRVYGEELLFVAVVCGCIGVSSLASFIAIKRMRLREDGKTVFEAIKLGNHMSLARYRDSTEWYKRDFVRLVCSELATPELLKKELWDRGLWGGVATLLGGLSMHKLATGRIRAAWLNLTLSWGVLPLVPFTTLAIAAIAILERIVHMIRLNDMQYYEQVVIGDREWF